MTTPIPATVADAERAAFEAAMIVLGYPENEFEGFMAEGEHAYYSRRANEMFDAWQAARAAGAPAETAKAVRDAKVTDLIAQIYASRSLAWRDSLFEQLIQAWEDAAPQIDATTRPSTLAEQIASAQAVVATWSPEMRAAVQLEGGGVAPATAPDVAKDAARPNPGGASPCSKVLRQAGYRDTPKVCWKCGDEAKCTAMGALPPTGSEKA